MENTNASSRHSGEGESVPLGGVDLLNTSIRHDRRDPPVSERLKRFVVKEYSPQALIPSLTWVPDYLRGGWKNNLYNDVAAGLTVGAFLVPQGMSYALVAELPPIYGLYTASIPLIVYALLGTSRQLAVGPVAIMSLIVGHGVSSIVDPRLEDNSPNPEFIALVVATSLLNGILLSIMGILRLGFVTSFLSHPVVSGFTSAAALVIGMGQMKHVLGYNLSKSENFFEVLIDMLGRLGESHWPSVIMALMTMGLLYTFKNVKVLKKLPAAMIVVVISILVSWGLQLEADYGFKICGEIPGGIPVPKIPAIPASEKLSPLLTVVIVSSMIGYMESIAVGLTYAGKNHYQISSNQELIAFGASNIIGSFFLAYPNAGGFGRSAVNANSGAKTQAAGLVSGLFILIVLAFLTPLFHHLPKPALGGIVIMAVTGLFDYPEPIHLYKTEAWSDLVSNLVTFFATLILGAELGIGVGVGCSLLTFLAVTSTPAYVILGRVGGTEHYFNVDVFSEAQEIPGTLIIRFDADMWFANAARFKEIVMREAYARAEQGELSRLILSFQGVNMIDSSAIHALHEMVDELRSQGCMTVSIAAARRVVRSRIIRELQPKGFVSPAAEPTVLVNGFSTSNIREAFMAHPQTVDGTLPRWQCKTLAELMSKLGGKGGKDPKVEPYKRVSLVQALVKVLEAPSEQTMVEVDDAEGGGLERLSFSEFMAEFCPQSGGGEGAENDCKRDVILYPSVHAAVMYDLTVSGDSARDLLLRDTGAAASAEAVVPENVSGPVENVV